MTDNSSSSSTAPAQSKSPAQAKQENPWISILVTVVIPVIILNKGSKIIGPIPALFVALAFPLGYGIREMITSGKPSMLSALGVLNTLFTGGFALTRLSGMWFAVKEAVFPLLIGTFVFFSSFTRRPFMQFLFKNPQIINTEALDENLSKKGLTEDFILLMKSSTQLLSISFLVSAILNFGLAYHIFVPIATDISDDAQMEALNTQIAEMTNWSIPVIMVPSMIILGFIFFWVMKKVQAMSGLTQDELIRTK